MSSRQILLPLALLAAGFALGLAFSHAGFRRLGDAPQALNARTGPPEENSVHEPGNFSSEPKVLYWYDPMYPARQFDKPGKSPFMDMDLVPRYAEDASSGGIRIDPTQVQNLAARTQKAERGRLVFTRDIPANISFNDYQISRVQPRAEGFVEKTHVLAVGDMVSAGAPLADITVPGWAADQSEYLLLKNRRAAPEIIRGVRERMRLSGMPEEMLRAVDGTNSVQTRMTIYAPLSGVITAFDVFPGMNVDKSMTIAVIQGVNPIWATADVPERDMRLVEGSRRIRLTVPAWPGLAFYADSFTLLPKADPETRTVPLRLTLANPEGKLKPGLTATVRLRGVGEETLLIPSQSLIDLGEEQHVIIRAADGAFVPKKVQVSHSSAEQTAIAAGLEPGDEIVVSGLFLIDSEANLRGALERMRRDAADKHPGVSPVMPQEQNTPEAER